MPAAIRSVTKLRRLLKSTEPVHLTGRGRFRGFTTVAGRKLRGLTKVLEQHLFSEGHLPRAPLHARPIAGRGVNSGRRTWRGPNAGRSRGVAVDRQLSALANGRKVPSPRRALTESSSRSATGPSLLRLTKLAVAALDSVGLTMVCAQRGVCSHSKRMATAIDLVCHRASDDALVVVEVKCGFHGVRRQPARLRGREMLLGPPLSRCLDTALHRHLAQLTITRHLFAAERTTHTTLREQCDVGTGGIDALLLYASDDDVELVALPDWWRERAEKIVRQCGAV